MTSEPAVRRAVAFVDGQNLYYAAKEAFGYTFPNFDPGALAQAVASLSGWHLAHTCFYTGVPDETDNAHWSQFWRAKLAVMGTR
ncbi:MAG: NYN domain-containing protein, partial [Candidatus Eiseniibacteriota bacterium]